jgi:hypothetical protein
MKNDLARPEEDAGHDLREIPKWTRRYAQNRALPFLAFIGIFIAGSAVFAGVPFLIKWALSRGDRLLAAVFTVALCGFAVWWLWFSFVGGARIMKQITERLYRGEGSVSTGGMPDALPGRRAYLAVFLFMFCILASVGLGLLGLLPQYYMQPISALYVVPFLMYLWAKCRPGASPFMLLWPGLYALHAVLIVAGAPVHFSGRYEVLNMFLPVVGYGVIAGLAGHIYSRIALRRLRALARSPAMPGHNGSEA